MRYYMSVVSLFFVYCFASILWHIHKILSGKVERTEKRPKLRKWMKSEVGEKMSNHLYLWALIISGLFWLLFFFASNHHIDHPFQWQHKWITLQQPFPYIFIHFYFFLFLFCFCFYFYFLYMCICADLPLTCSSANANVVNTTKIKNYHPFAFIQLCRWLLLFVWQNSKTIRKHTLGLI